MRSFYFFSLLQVDFGMIKKQECSYCIDSIQKEHFSSSSSSPLLFDSCIHCCSMKTFFSCFCFIDLILLNGLVRLSLSDFELFIFYLKFILKISLTHFFYVFLSHLKHSKTNGRLETFIHNDFSCCLTKKFFVGFFSFSWLVWLLWSWRKCYLGQ